VSDAAADGARAGVSDLPPWPQRFGFIAAVFGMFMAILDIQIVASSLNEIQAGLSASQDEISWVQTAYLIAEIVMIPLSGMLMRILSTRVAFTLSCAGFTLASLGCALAGSIEQLIVLRAIQGFAGGAMIPITQAVSFSIFPRRVMGSVQAVIGMVVTMAPSVGPTVGGYLTDIASWHWLFLANVIPGVLVCWAAWTFLDIDKADHAVARRLDWLREHPIVDLYAFANRNFALGAGLGFIIGIALYGLVYLMPLFFGHVRHFSSLQIGEVMFVTGLTMFFCAPIVGQLSNRVDLRLLLLAGLLLVGIGSMMNADLTVESGFWQFFWPQVVRGMGLILCIIPASRIALGTLPPHEVGNASGLFNVMRNLGGAVGLALLDTVRDWREDFHWNALAPAIDTGREVVVAEIAKYEAMLAGSVPDAHRAAVGMLVQRLSEQTVVMAFNDIFLWLGMIYLLSVPLVFLLRRIEA